MSLLAELSHSGLSGMAVVLAASAVMNLVFIYTVALMSNDRMSPTFFNLWMVIATPVTTALFFLKVGVFSG